MTAKFDTKWLALQCGALPYSPAPMRAVRGLSLTYEQLEAFAKAVSLAAVVGQANFPDDEVESLAYRHKSSSVILDDRLRYITFTRAGLMALAQDVLLLAAQAQTQTPA